MRKAYASHMVALTDAAPQLLICFSYDQSLFAGPPFSVSGAEVLQLYGPEYAISCLADYPAKGGIRGNPALEMVWHLARKD